MMVRFLVQIGTALRTQSQAIRFAQRLQRQFFNQRVTQQSLDIGPGAAFKQRIRILRLVFAGDNVDFLFLDAALAIFAALTGRNVCGLVFIREERGDVHRPIALDRFQATGAFRMHGGADAGVENQAVNNRIKRSDNSDVSTLLNADDLIADAARCGERCVDLLALPGSRGDLRHGNRPRGIFDTCHVQPSIQLSG